MRVLRLYRCDKVDRIRERTVATDAAAGETGAEFLARLERDSERVQGLAAEGLTAWEIIEATGLSAVSVTAYLHGAGRTDQPGVSGTPPRCPSCLTSS